MNVIKKTVFYSLLLAPLAVLLVCLVYAGHKVYQLNRVDQGKIYRDLERYYASRDPEHRIVFLTQKGVPGYIFSGDMSPARFVSLDFPENAYVVYVFGESSVTLPDMEHSFPRLLGDALQQESPERPVVVVNFGFTGIDSFILKKRVSQALAYRKPDLVLVYAGHNDYNVAYRHVIKKPYYILSDKVSRVLFNRLVLPLYKVPWFAEEIYFEPRVLRYLQQRGLLKVRDGYFGKCNDLILEHYKENIGEVISLCRKDEVRLLLVTLVCNLEARPFGINQVVDPLYEQGINTREYAERIRLLRMARDAEVFTGDIRAKTPMNDYLRSIHEPGVYVCDLEQALYERKSAFGPAMFYDYFHFKEEVHKKIARILVDYLHREMGTP